MEITADEAMKLVQGAEKLSPDEILHLQRERLQRLVDFARQHSAFYGKLYRDLPEKWELSHLPPVDKQTLLGAGYENWWTDGEIRRQEATAYLEQDTATRGLFMGKYTMLTTSGTTGEPLMMLRDGCHNAVHGAMMRARLGKTFGDLADFRKYRHAALIFDDPKVSSYSAYLRAKANLKGYEKNLICVPLRYSLEEKVRILNEFQPEAISCYPSEMLMMALEQRKGKLNISPKGIACSAEMLTGETYEILRETFPGCRIINNYCMTEGGELAFMSGCPHLHINTDWVILEPVDENRRDILDSDTWSKGVLVTDLANFVQPIIRYYVEDSVRISPSACGENPFPRLEILGRVGTACRLCGQEVSSNLFLHLAEELPGMLLCQFVQTGPATLEVRAVLAEESPEAKEKALAKVRQALTEAGCGNCRLLWSDEPPLRNAKGGKVRGYINLGD